MEEWLALDCIKMITVLSSDQNESRGGFVMLQDIQLKSLMAVTSKERRVNFSSLPRFIKKVKKLFINEKS